MKDDEELELLLGEIPHAIHHPYNFSNVHQYPHDHVSHQDGFDEMMSNDIGMKHDKGDNICMYNEDTLNHHKFACASPVSGFSLQSDGSSSSLFSVVHSTSDNVSPTSSLEELRPNLLNGSSKNHNVLSKDLEASDAPAKKLVNGSTIDEGGLSKNLSQMYINDHKEFVPVGLNCVPNHDQSVKEAVFQINPEKRVASANNMFGISNYGVSQSCIPKGLQNVDVDKDPAFCHNVNFGSHYSTTMSDLYGSPSTFVNHAMNPRVNGVEHAGQFYHMGFPLFEFPEALAGPLITDGAHYAKQNGMKPYERMGAFISPMVPHLIPPHNPQFKAENAFSFQPQVVTGKSQVPHAKVPQWKIDALTKGKSLVQGLNYTMGKSKEHHKVHNSIATFQGSCRQRHQDKRSFLEHRQRFQRMPEIGRNDKMHCSFTLPSKFNSLVEAQGYIYYIAKDQHGCRFLQRMFDEGTPRDVQIIFNEIITHVIELMINPFGNYLMQKLLEVCNEEQRMQILLKVTQEPGELVRISLNTHGTRVVQKLIETLKTKHQVSLVISALEPGFIALIKDLNGNHLKIPSVISKLVSQFEGSYVHLSKQKFSSHVVEKCLSMCGDKIQSTIIQELLCETHFEQLLQDPHANYVIQTAVRVTEGPLLDLLLDAIESHKTISRNSPYSKRIFSHKLLKK
ncbi:hypothetical protein Leryth_013176 [Lithospermum erythrorhizon]|nr:hypothetical protein Leryth_013176 [Lithospermum erythrorhizon]